MPQVLELKDAAIGIQDYNNRALVPFLGLDQAQDFNKVALLPAD